VILCCQDWKRETLYGNLYNDSLYNIINSKRHKDLIDKVYGKKKSDLLFICKRCRFNKVREK